MSSSPDAAAPGVAAALDVLRGQPNPFEALVRPQRPDDRFADLHVAALLRGPRALLLRVVDRYRLAEYRAARDLPETRVVTVLGPRGAGKTHTLEALGQRDDGLTQLLVRPSFLETGVPFEEYLLGQLLNALLEDDPLRGGRPFDAIAGQLTRRLLCQAVRGLGPTERLFASGPSRRERLWLLWRGGERRVARFEALAADLADSSAAPDLHALVRKHGFAPDYLLELLTAHVRRWEQGDGTLPAIRRQLYLAMARTALLRDGAALTLFLEADYTPAGARPFYRGEVVRQLLHAVIEACALVQLPVVFAFDNLEGFLAPQGQLRAELGRAFLDGLAQAVDGTRGLLFLLFAETTLYRQLRQQTHQFALDRLDQGVPLHAQGPVDLVELRPPDFGELQELLTARLGRLLQEVPGARALPPGFPFGKAFLDDLAGRSGLGLRNLLLRLRDEYSRVVYGRSVPAAPPAPPAAPRDWAPVLEGAWAEQLRGVDHKLQGSLLSQRPALHVGLGRLLQLAGPRAVDGWQLAEVQPTVSVGSHPGYGLVSIAEWRRAAANGAAHEGHAAVRVGIGLLLAGGTGMPRDLRAKVEVFDDPALRADALVVLWPHPPADDLAATLPRATGQVWADVAGRRSVALRALSDDHVRVLLALPAWLEACQAAEEPAPAGVVQSFVLERGAALIRLALPPVAEGVTVHAD